MQATITLKNKGGHYEAAPDVLDMMMERYLPNSVAGLRNIVSEAVNGDTWDNIVSRGDQDRGVNYGNVHTITELLMVLADIENDRRKVEEIARAKEYVLDALKGR